MSVKFNNRHKGQWPEEQRNDTYLYFTFNFILFNSV